MLSTLLLFFFSTTANALSWSDLFLRDDQQGARLLAAGQPDKAAAKFCDSEWQGVAHYRAGHFQQAATAFSQKKTPEAHYNRGNALAKAGQYQAAITAYEEALKHSPNHADAKYNLAIVKKLQNQTAPKDSPETSPQLNKKNSDQPPKENSATLKNNQHNPPKEPEKKPSPQLQTQQKSLQSEQKKEQQEVNQQLLQEILDDPGSLLKQKFQRDYEQMTYK